MKYKARNKARVRKDLISGKSCGSFKTVDHRYIWTDEMLGSTNKHKCDCSCTEKGYLTTNEIS
jgi:hypothetical protein